MVSFNECPIQDGDIIYIRKFRKEQRFRKSGGEWVPVPGVYDIWLTDYMKVALE